MKKEIVSVLLTVFFFALSSFPVANAESKRDAEKAVFVLPSSLEKIEDEAFKGTAARTVLFQESLIYIGNSAFENSRFLTDIYIPATTEYIGEHAFPSNERLTVHGVIGSLAERWAKEHYVPFVPSNVWNLIGDSRDADDTGRIPTDRYHQAMNSEKINNLHGRTEDEGKSMRPQERPELNPIDYRFP